MQFKFPIVASASLLLMGGCQSKESKQEAKQPNVLFICVDDLRRDLGCYGSEVISPHMDRLAERGSLFHNHYVQVPTSGASRSSMLTGYYPKQWSDMSNEACRINLSGKPEQEHPETMFHHLRRNGYYTVGIGKISHSVDGLLYGYTDPVGDEWELPHSWDEMLFDSGKWGTGWNAFFGYADGSNRQGEDYLVKPYECADVSDEDYPDGLTANLAVQKLKELAGRDEPFCLAVGFFKPHLPFNAPQKYWDLYDAEDISLSDVPFIPEGTAKRTLHPSGEFKSYKSGDEMPSLEAAVSDEYARKLRHAYFAAISYVDAQIGKVLDALEESGQADNTLIVLWGDHGWHLGDHLMWGKHTLLDTSLGSAFMVVAPGMKGGIDNHRIVGSVDIYPTLMELCHVDVPEGLDGSSFVSLLNNPDDKYWKDVAYSYFNNGISVRTPVYRLGRHFYKDEEITELYRYDEDQFERKNIADEMGDVVESLLPLWEEGNTLGY